MTKQAKQGSPWLPLGERVLLKPLEKPKKEENKTTSGIIIPDSVAQDEEKKSPLATVVAVSPYLHGEWAKGGLDETNYPLKPGDTVLISSTGNDRLKLNGETFIIAPIDNVLAKKV